MIFSFPGFGEMKWWAVSDDEQLVRDVVRAPPATTISLDRGDAIMEQDNTVWVITRGGNVDTALCVRGAVTGLRRC